MVPKRWKRKTIVSKVSRKWVPVWRAGICKWKQVSHAGSRDDHGQPIAGGNDQKCSRSTGIQEPSCANHLSQDAVDKYNSIIKKRCKLDIRKCFFSERVIQRWNHLSQDAVDQATLNGFKRALNKRRIKEMDFFIVRQVLWSHHLWVSTFRTW